jgi:hypothetical protein
VLGTEKHRPWTVAHQFEEREVKLKWQLEEQQT